MRLQSLLTMLFCRRYLGNCNISTVPAGLFEGIPNTSSMSMYVLYTVTVTVTVTGYLF
jgi:hypothetical protein